MTQRPLAKFYNVFGRDYPDCDPRSNLDTYITDRFHQRFLGAHGCVLPFWTGDTFASSEKVPLCTIHDVRQGTNVSLEELYDGDEGNSLLEEALESVQKMPCEHTKVTVDEHKHKMK